MKYIYALLFLLALPALAQTPTMKVSVMPAPQAAALLKVPPANEVPLPAEPQAPPPPTGKITVVVSFSILADMVREIGGDHVIVIPLVGPDSDAHAFSPTPQDAKTLATAKLVIINGLGFEGWMGRLVQASGYPGEVVVASDGVTPLMAGGAPDPHAWQNVSNGEIYAKNIANALASADASHAPDYLINADRYRKELYALDQWVMQKMAKVPQDKRRAITSHDALQYFAKAYDVQFIAPLGVSTAGDASAGDIARLIDQIRSSHIRAVFMENMSDPRLVKQLVSDGGAVIGGTLYTDALSAPGGPAASYIAMFRHNVETLTRAIMQN